MSVSINKQTSLLAQPVGPAPHSSSAISPKVEAMRFYFLDEIGFTSKMPILEGLRVKQIINDYIGPDETQETDVLRTFSSVASDARSAKLLSPLLRAQGTLVLNRILSVSESLDSSQEDFLENTMRDNLYMIISADPSITSRSIVEARTDDLARLSLLTDLFTKAAIATIEQCAKEFGREWGDKAIAATIKGFLDEHMHVVDKHCRVEKEVMLKKDRPHIAHWINQVVRVQQNAAPLFSRSIIRRGDSEGFTYAIKKEGETYGYLYGTLHSRVYKINRLVKATQRRLLECSILGMEINMTRDIAPSSVEKSLLICASQRGIARIGIDDENRLDKEEHAGFCPKVDFLKFQIYRYMYARAYRVGNIAASKKVREQLYDGHPLIHPAYEVQQLKRNQSMADNIDALLKGCIHVQKETRSPIKCFFAVGLSHVLDSQLNVKNVVELLREKEWTLEFLPPMPFS